MRYVLGFDGGGTKTDCVLMDEVCEVLARSRSGPSNPSRVGMDAAAAALVDSAEQALLASGRSATEIATIHGGIAGIGAANAMQTLAARLKLKFPNANVLLNTDLSMSLLATQETPSVVVIAGTGSAAIGRSSPQTLAREGGWGPLLGDPGSAYDVGRKAVILGLRARLRGQHSSLGNAILDAFHCNWVELQEQIRSHADDVLPKIFPIVVKAASEDDPARTLLHAAAQDLSHLAASVIESLQLERRPFFLAKVGGVFGRSQLLDDRFDAFVRNMAPSARIGPLPKPIAEFAAEAAANCLGSVTLSHGD
jgi:N-acetylglucosamine kinase-like BadF-type ATPase